ncbi:MAG: Acetoin:2,6-dichlorophenolindophenol oxidoreductase subunit alpha, partial [Planctomycetota bacterium]
MASIWKLPVLFICENNQFATEVPFSYSSGNPSVGNRGAAYGMPGFEVDGNDVLAITEVAKTAVARARAGQGPTLIECRTYRTRAHSEGMGDFTYRTREDVELWKTRCPIARLRQSHPQLSAEFDAIDASIRDQVRAARETAAAAKPPESSLASLHIYSSKRPATAPAVEPEPGSRQLTWGQATLEALTHAMSQNSSIFV